MHIIIFAHFAGSPKHGMVYGHYYLAKEWVKLGHKVTIVTASFVHTRFKQPEQTGRTTIEIIDGIRYVWLPTPSYNPKSSFGRIRNILLFTFRCHVSKLPFSKADLIICSSHHPFPIFAARKYAKKFNSKLVFEVRDLWPLTLIELGSANRRNPFISLMQYAEDYAYKTADRVISVLPKAKLYMETRGMSPEKFMFIPNGANLREQSNKKPLPDLYNHQLRKLRNEGKFIIGYVGKIGLSNALHTFIEALALCNNNKIVFTILGSGAYLEELINQATKLNIKENLVVFEPVSKDQVGSFLNYLDVAYIGLQKKSIFRFGVSPTKLNDFMLAAKPVISTIDAPGDIIKESGAGITCSPENPIALSKAIKDIMNLNKKQREQMGQNGYKWLHKNRDYQILAKKFLHSVVEN